MPDCNKTDEVKPRWRDWAFSVLVVALCLKIKEDEVIFEEHKILAVSDE